MMLTREQAAATWCPLVRIVAATEDGFVAHAQPAYNRVGVPGDPEPSWPTAGRCLAEDCAMWRWAPPGDYDGHDARGYCGLAGSPHIVGGSYQ